MHIRSGSRGVTRAAACHRLLQKTHQSLTWPLCGRIESNRIMTEQGRTTSKDDDDDDDGNMTPEERMAWLRERGVLVETAEERHRQQVADALKLADQLESSEVSYVLVPADTSQPLRELQFQPVVGRPGDQLLEHLRRTARFAKKDGERVDTELLRQQQQTTTNLAAGGADAAASAVSDATLQQVAAQANVETFSLVHPMPSNNFTGISIYLDEVGMLKRLPLNQRASDYAERAGFSPPPQFFGDVYLGRTRQKPALQNLSFVLGPDTAPDAPWLRAATTQNLEHQMELNRITGRRDAQQPAISGSDGKAVVEEGYAWTQTEEELEVVVPLSADATSKEVSVKFRPQSLQVALRGSKEPLVTLSLFERVDVDACTWTLERADGSNDNQKRLVVTMEKLEPAFWPRIRD